MDPKNIHPSLQGEEAYALRLKRVPFSGIRKVFDAVRVMEARGQDVIHWQIGRPDFDTPEHIKKAAAAALERGEVHYAPNMGIPPLRKAIAERTRLDTGLEVDSDRQVIVMSGANEGIMVAMLALLNPGDEVIVAGPNWHHYKSCAALAEGNPVEVPTRQEDNFSLRAAEVEKRITDRTRLLCVTSPGNPTGCVESRENLAALAELAVRHNLLVLSDEIYNRIYYGPADAAPARADTKVPSGDLEDSASMAVASALPPSLARADTEPSMAVASALPPSLARADTEPSMAVAPSIYSMPGMAERTIIINGFSKTYSMDGWRLGWTTASPELTRALLKVRQYTTVCVNTFIQHGAAAALSADQDCVRRMVGAFAERRKVIVEGLRAIPGVSLAEPMGAFYAFPDMRAFGRSSQELADYLLEEHAIATVAGSVFGEAGEGHLRIAYSCSTEECARGVERLKKALKEL